MNLRSILSKVNGNTIISIDTSTTLPLTGGQKNPHKDRIQKVTVGSNVMVFQNKVLNGYKEMVQRRLAKEGKDNKFELSPRKWGTRVPDSPFVEHKGEDYLEVIVLRPGVVHYELDGKSILPRDINGFKDEYLGGEQGGLENKVVIKTYSFASLTRIVVDKVAYKLK